MDIYQSARLVGASGNLQKNKGVMFTGAAGNTCDVRVKGLSAGDGDSQTGWVTSTIRLTIAGSLENAPIILPIAVYGATLGTGSLYELN